MSKSLPPARKYKSNKNRISPKGRMDRWRFDSSFQESLFKFSLNLSASVSGPHSRRIENAAERYKEGRISLGRAAEISNIPYREMIEELKNRDIKIRFGPKSIEEAEKDIDMIRKNRD